MNNKEAIEGYKLLQKLVKEITDYVFSNKLSYDYFEIIRDTLIIVYNDNFKGEDDYTTIDIPLINIENNNWKEYIDNKKDDE